MARRHHDGRDAMTTATRNPGPAPVRACRVAMPTNRSNATLEVRDFPSNGSDGYIDTTASNNAVYSYRYTGGSDDAGGLLGKGNGGTATLNLTLDSDPRYTIDSVTFDGLDNQLSWRGNAPRNGVITDQNTAAGSGNYHVVVRDATANCTVPCDPMISNEPRDPPMLSRK